MIGVDLLCCTRCGEWHWRCSAQVVEGQLSTRTLGILAGVVGSALGAWLWTTQRGSRTSTQVPAPRDHGTVIFDNTPLAEDSEAII